MIGLLVLPSILLLLAALACLRARVAVRVTGDRLVVLVLGLDRLWCLRRRIEVPLAQVLSARVADRHDLPKPGIRLGGTWIPGLIVAGNYGWRPHRQFWDVRRGKQLLHIALDPAAPYRHLVLEVEDPAAVAATLARV